MSFTVINNPWYGIGTKVNEAVCSQEAMKLANLDWEVVQKNIQVDNKDIPGYIANVRNEDGYVLGIVSNQYKVIQNSEVFSFADNLINHDIKYDSAGSLLNGKKIYLTAKLPSTKLLNKTIDNYLIFSNSHDGKGSIRVAIVPVDSTFKNPLNLPLKDANRSWSTIHSGNLENKMDQAKETLNLSEDYLTNLVLETERLSKINVTDKQKSAFIEKLFPIKPQDGDRRIDNIISIRDELNKIIENSEYYKDTQWGLINSVSVFISNLEPKRQSSTFYENKFNNIICGNHLLDKAYKILC